VAEIMGIQVNIGDHVSPVAGFVAVPNEHRKATNWARTKAKAIAKGMPGADVYFKTLPGGRTLTQLLNDSTIWINFEPGTTLFGHGEVGGKELSIGPIAYKMGKWSVLASLIHELAHINGVPNAVADKRAEEALLHCGLGKKSEQTSGVDDPRTPYNPNFGG
jgi:hypothetical protein